MLVHQELDSLASRHARDVESLTQVGIRRKEITWFTGRDKLTQVRSDIEIHSLATHGALP
jgi:hypothetical protein